MSWFELIDFPSSSAARDGKSSLIFDPRTKPLSNHSFSIKFTFLQRNETVKHEHVSESQFITARLAAAGLTAGKRDPTSLRSHT